MLIAQGPRSDNLSAEAQISRKGHWLIGIISGWYKDFGDEVGLNTLKVTAVFRYPVMLFKNNE